MNEKRAEQLADMIGDMIDELTKHKQELWLQRLNFLVASKILEIKGELKLER